MNILGIDCSASIMSISLKCGDRLFESAVHDGFRHSENLMPQIDNQFKLAGIKPQELDLVAVASGPGSFTGLRIAMSTAKGIAMGAGAELVSVPTLDAYSFAHKDFAGAVVPVIDAKKKRFFAAVYHKNKKLTKDLDIDPTDLIGSLSGYESIMLTGPDAHRFEDFAKKDAKIVIDRNFKSVTGTTVIQLGLSRMEDSGPDKHGSGPVYIRKSEAEISMFGE